MVYNETLYSYYYKNGEITIKDEGTKGNVQGYYFYSNENNQVYLIDHIYPADNEGQYFYKFDKVIDKEKFKKEIFNLIGLVIQDKERDILFLKKSQKDLTNEE